MSKFNDYVVFCYQNQIFEKLFNLHLSSSNDKTWTTLSSQEKYDNPWINVTEYQIINPAGKPGIYGKVHFKNKAIGIVALDHDQNTWLVANIASH